MPKLSPEGADDLHHDLIPIKAAMYAVAEKHGVGQRTIVKHMRLLPVPVPGLHSWNGSIAKVMRREG